MVWLKTWFYVSITCTHANMQAPEMLIRVSHGRFWGWMERAPKSLAECLSAGSDSGTFLDWSLDLFTRGVMEKPTPRRDTWVLAGRAGGITGVGSHSRRSGRTENPGRIPRTSNHEAHRLTPSSVCEGAAPYQRATTSLCSSNASAHTRVPEASSQLSTPCSQFLQMLQTPFACPLWQEMRVHTCAYVKMKCYLFAHIIAHSPYINLFFIILLILIFFLETFWFCSRFYLKCVCSMCTVFARHLVEHYMIFFLHPLHTLLFYAPKVPLGINIVPFLLLLVIIIYWFPWGNSLYLLQHVLCRWEPAGCEGQPPVTASREPWPFRGRAEEPTDVQVGLKPVTFWSQAQSLDPLCHTLSTVSSW